MDKIQTCLCVYDDINVLSITETHLKKSELDAEIEIEGCAAQKNFLGKIGILTLRIMILQQKIQVLIIVQDGAL